MEYLTGRWMNFIPGYTDPELIDLIKHQRRVVRENQHKTNHLSVSATAEAREFLLDAEREVRNREISYLLQGVHA